MFKESSQNTKSFNIFISQPNSEKVFFQRVNVLKSAKVKELIGLICCKYQLECLKPELKYRDVSKYCLRICENNGEVETEFPALESDKCVSVFGFDALCLMQVENDTESEIETKEANESKIKVLM